jgi:hypothetical protein
MRMLRPIRQADHLVHGPAECCSAHHGRHLSSSLDPSSFPGPIRGNKGNGSFRTGCNLLLWYRPVGGLRQRSAPTPGAVAPPTRRLRERGSATPRLAQARRTGRSTDLQFVPVLTSFQGRHARVLSRRPSSSIGIRDGHPFAVIHGSLAALVPSARRPSARPACRLLRGRLSYEVPGFGAGCSLIRLAMWDRRAGVAADLRSSARADRRWRGCRRLRSLLAANQWIAETSAVVGPIVRGPSPHSLPIESPLVPGTGRGPFRREARTWSPGKRRGTGSGPWPRPDHSDRQGPEPNEEASGEAEGQGRDSVETGDGARRCAAPDCAALLSP